MQELKTEQKAIFEPRIVTFACNWCAYAGADLAGVSRKQYPANVRIIRTMCSGRFDPAFIMRAFEKGADGVLILGCHPGDCQYIEGNLKARKKFEMTEKLLRGVGFGTERLEMHWVSASEAPLFVEVITKFVEKLRGMGPNPIKDAYGEIEK